MKKPSSDTLGDLLKLGEAALATLLGAAKEGGEQIKGKGDILVRKLDLVTRDEFDAAFATVKKLRAMQDTLAKRLDSLEKKKDRKPRVSSPRKPVAKNKSRKK